MSQVLTKPVAVTSSAMGGPPDAGPSSFVIREASPSPAMTANKTQSSHLQHQHQYRAPNGGSPTVPPGSPSKPADASPIRAPIGVALYNSKASIDAGLIAAACKPHSINTFPPPIASHRHLPSTAPSASSTLSLGQVQSEASAQASRLPASPSRAPPGPPTRIKSDDLRSRPVRREFVDLTQDDDGPCVDLTQDEPIRGVKLRHPSSSPVKPPPASTFIARPGTSDFRQQPLAQPQAPPKPPRPPAHVKATILPPPTEPRLRSVLGGSGQLALWQSHHRIQKRPKHEGKKRTRLVCDWAVRRGEFTAKEYRTAQRCLRTFATAEALLRHVVGHVRVSRRAASAAAKVSSPAVNPSGANATFHRSHSAPRAYKPKIGCDYAECASSLKTWHSQDLIRHLIETHFASHAFACPFDSCRLSDFAQGQIRDATALQNHIQLYHDEGDPVRLLMAPVKPANKLAPPPPLPAGIVPWHKVSMPFPIKVINSDWRAAPYVPKPSVEGVLAEAAAPAEPGVQPWPKLIQMWTHLEPPAIPLQIDRSKTQKLEAVYLDAPLVPLVSDRDPLDFSNAELARMRRGQPPVKRLRLSSSSSGRQEVAYVDIEPMEWGRDKDCESEDEPKPSLRKIPVFPRNFKLATPPPPREIPDMPDWSDAESDGEKERDHRLRAPSASSQLDIEDFDGEEEESEDSSPASGVTATSEMSTAPFLSNAVQHQQQQPLPPPRATVQPTLDQLWTTSATSQPVIIGSSSLSKGTIEQRPRGAESGMESGDADADVEDEAEGKGVGMVLDQAEAQDKAEARGQVDAKSEELSAPLVPQTLPPAAQAPSGEAAAAPSSALAANPAPAPGIAPAAGIAPAHIAPTPTPPAQPSASPSTTAPPSSPSGLYAGFDLGRLLDARRFSGGLLGDTLSLARNPWSSRSLPQSQSPPQGPSGSGLASQPTADNGGSRAPPASAPTP